MKRFGKIIAGALVAAGTMAAATVATTAPADARVSVGIGIGVPGPGFYGPGYYPPGPCYAYRYAYSGYCGYPAYAGPVFIDGAWYNGPHYYRYWGGRPWVWARGGWHSGYRGGYRGGWGGYAHGRHWHH